MAEKVKDESRQSQALSLWRENHGNLLMAVIVGVFVVGAIALFISQNRLRKPRFPDAHAIQQVSERPEPALLGQNADSELTIVVIGAANNTGTIKAALYDSIEKFNDPKKAFRKESIAIKDGEAKLKIRASQLPERFAVAAFHDENDDGELNRNRIGIPTERYGFSRNARGLTGPPPFKDVVVERAKLPDLLQISIR